MFEQSLRMMFRTALFLGVLTTAGLVSIACRADGRASQSGMEAIDASNSEVENSAAIIQHGKTRDVRAKEAVRLTQWIRRNPTKVSDSDITILISLLRDEDDVIRGEAAGSIGFVGHRAISAAPALLQALRERPCTKQPGASADAMRVALDRIGAAPVDVPCPDPLGMP
jgi:hypothetical protein